MRKLHRKTWVIIIFHLVLITGWLVLFWQTSIRLKGIEVKAIMPGWNAGFFCFYIAVAIVYFTESDFAGKKEIIFIRFVSIPIFLIFCLISVSAIRATFLDVFIEKPIFKYVEIKERQSASRSRDKIYIYGEGESYDAVDGKVILKPNHYYHVEIFRHNRVMIGLEIIKSKQ